MKKRIFTILGKILVESSDINEVKKNEILIEKDSDNKIALLSRDNNGNLVNIGKEDISILPVLYLVKFHIRNPKLDSYPRLSLPNGNCIVSTGPLEEETSLGDTIEIKVRTRNGRDIVYKKQVKDFPKNSICIIDSNTGKITYPIPDGFYRIPNIEKNTVIEIKNGINQTLFNHNIKSIKKTADIPALDIFNEKTAILVYKDILSPFKQRNLNIQTLFEKRIFTLINDGYS